MRTRTSRPKGIVRPLDPDDPRSLSHPSHKEQLLELARALGRMEAREEFAMHHGNRGPRNARDKVDD